MPGRPSKPFRGKIPRSCRKWDKLKSDPTYKPGPEKVQHFCLMVDPALYLVRTDKEKPSTVAGAIEELVQRDLAHAIRIKLKSGEEKWDVRFNPRGRARYTINRYLLARKPFSDLPRETRERLAQYHVIELVLHHDYDSKTGKYDHYQRLGRNNIVSLLLRQTDILRINRFCNSFFGPQERWSDLDQRYYHFLVQRAALAVSALKLLEAESSWNEWMHLRQQGELDTLLP